MKILVINTAASTSGALTELKKFYDNIKLLDSSIYEWHFVLGLAELDETKNIKVKRYPWVKKNWVFRVLFDFFYSKIIVKNIKPDYIVSLQNVCLPIKGIPQILYVQLCFPFIEHKFSFFDFQLWFHQNFVGYLIKKSVKNAYVVVVQNDWIRESCLKISGRNENNTYVCPPDFLIEQNFYDRFRFNENSTRRFFYPATPLSYKNHKLIVGAVYEIIKKYGIPFEVYFTVDGSENKSMKKLKNMIHKYNLPIQMLGVLNQQKVFDLYKDSILIFPSLLETIGLPLVEASAHGTIIFAYDENYAHDVLDNYSDVFYFKDEKSLCDLMLKAITDKITYSGGIIKEKKDVVNWATLFNNYIFNKDIKQF